MRRLLPALLGLTVLAAVVPAAASAIPAAGPQPPACRLLGPRKAIDHPLTLPDGTTVLARDPYGGLLARNRLFFDFSVHAQGSRAPTGIAEVTWSLDGRVVRPPWPMLSVPAARPRAERGAASAATTCASRAAARRCCAAAR